MEPNPEPQRHFEEGHHAMKMFIPFLVLPLAFGMLRHMARRMHRYGMAGHRHAAWHHGGVPPFFAEWHRQAHAADQPPTQHGVRGRNKKKRFFGRHAVRKISFFISRLANI